MWMKMEIKINQCSQTLRGADGAVSNRQSNLMSHFFLRRPALSGEELKLIGYGLLTF